MRLSTFALVLAIAIIAGIDYVASKKPSRSVTSSRRSSGRPSRDSSSKNRRPPISKRRDYDEDEDDEEYIGYDDPLGYDEDDYEAEIDIEVELEDDDEDYRPRRSHRKSSSKPSGGKNRGPAPRKSTPPRRSGRGSRYGDYPPPRRSSNRRNPPRRGPPSRGRQVVGWTPRQPPPSTFTRGLAAIRKSLPDPGSVKDAAMKSLSVARETTSGLSANLYREVKGLTSSELEQVMLKATRPDDTPVKGKHAERLVGVTYQISGRYDIYDAVLRKLWAKMVEKDWRTTIKALYILHRFSADGSPDHAPALKARVRELRRTRDPKRKGPFFDSKLLKAGDNKPETEKYRAFMGRYAHYVLLRAQCFGGMFDEISAPPAEKDKKKKNPRKPITSTSLRTDHLDAAKLLLKTGVACVLKKGEDNENTALAVERVASDLLGLTSAVAKALNRALKDDDLKGVDSVLIKQWCEFYSEELLPQTRSMVKQTTPILDAYGLFLPSRMGASVSQDLLQKGMRLEEADSTEGEVEEGEEGDDVSSETKKNVSTEQEKETDSIVEDEVEDVETAPPAENEDIGEEDEIDDVDELGDEYEYDDDDEEYYDDEDEL